LTSAEPCSRDRESRFRRLGSDPGRARRYLERELGHFERYCGGTSEALPLLKEIAALKQNSDRSWDERTRKEMEFAAPKIWPRSLSCRL
jgi:hypothetical protein